MLYGVDSVNPISRFINEISEDNKDIIDNNFISLYNKRVNNKSVDDSIVYNCEEKVFHNDFGEGVIVSVDKTILTIAFPSPYGIKKIIKGHSSIKK